VASGLSFSGNVQLDGVTSAGSFEWPVAPTPLVFGGAIQLDDVVSAGSFVLANLPLVFSGDIQLDDVVTAGSFSFNALSLPNPLCAARIVKARADGPTVGYVYAPPRFAKDPDAVSDYGFDMSAVLAQIPQDTVQAFDVIGNGLLTIQAVGNPAPALFGALVGGGHEGARAELTLRLTMTSGRVIDSTIVLLIRS
jgi:hypothetical protein